MASISGVISAINKLSKPLQKKVAKKLGIDVEGRPGRKTDSIVVGKDRVAAEKKINKLIGGGIGAGGTIAALSVGDIINELLGIKKMGDATLTEADKRKSRIGKAQAETTTTKTKKKTPPKLTKDDMPTPRPKTKKQFMKERSGKDSEVEFKVLKKSEGGLGLKKIPDTNPGLKALKKKAPDVVKKMGYMKMGGMMKKKKTGNTDYRKGGAVGMMITISDNMKKKGK
tara:strand:- start:85 stop:765 length:681 start_codon:yes stop_codon:yes gene_type:complete